MIDRFLQTVLAALVVGTLSYVVFGGVAALKHFAIALLVPMVVFGLSLLQKEEAAKTRQGWNRLTASHMQMCAFVLSAGMTALMLYVYFFVGSSRSDAAHQMRVLLGLIPAFAAGAAFMFFKCFIQQIRWNNQVVEYRLGGCTRHAIAWQDLASVQVSDMSAPIVLTATDGRTMKIDPTFDGVDQLMAEVGSHLPDIADPSAGAPT